MIDVQEDICREVPTQALQVRIITLSPILWGPVILLSHSDLKIVLQKVRTGNCNFFPTDPTEKNLLVLNSASYALSFKQIGN